MNRMLWYIGRRRPLLFFGIPGMIMLAVGLVVGVSVLNVVQQRHVILVARALVSVFLCLGGAMTVYAGLILSTVGKLEAELKGKRAGTGQPPADEPSASSQEPTSPSPAWPLLLFGIPGMLAVLAGLTWGVWAVGTLYAGHRLLYGSYIASASLTVAGLMTWLTGVVLHALHNLMAGRTKSEGTIAG
jgi:hypothetical protein